MTTKNDLTGDKLQSKISNKNYRDNWDAIFSKKKKEKDVKPDKRK